MSNCFVLNQKFCPDELYQKTELEMECSGEQRKRIDFQEAIGHLGDNASCCDVIGLFRMVALCTRRPSCLE